MPKVQLVVFDIGETLVCEDRLWRGWARWPEAKEARFRASSLHELPAALAA